ncbi:hypothetical protein GJAV_G00221110 [Gymnothorax javanicus]|nr:hypothetical protein GJAV_G00221110 [Gymnothorax javanicus]
MAGTPVYKWTEEETIKLIQTRSKNDHLFTGKKYAAKKAWEEVLKQMDVKVGASTTQVKKKWDNLKHKYKELRRAATWTGGDEGAVTAATWPFYNAMHDAVSRGGSIDSAFLIDSFAAENTVHSTDAASDASSSSPRGSVLLTLSGSCLDEEDDAHLSHSWPEKDTMTLIRLRAENEHLFTGRRHTAKNAWAEILQKMGLQDLVSPAHAAKKWSNLKRKYKELRRSTTESEPDRGEVTAATWPFYSAMHEAVGGEESGDSPVLICSGVAEDLSDEGSDASGSCNGSVTASDDVVCVELREEEVEEEVEDPQPGCGCLEQADGEPGSSGCPPSPKRRRTCQGDILKFLKEEAVREEQRFRAALESTNRFLDLFEQLVDKL